MKTKAMTMEDIRSEGIEILGREIGPVNAIRFLQQFDSGKGNYTEQRRKYLGKMKVKDIIKH